MHFLLIFLAPSLFAQLSITTVDPAVVAGSTLNLAASGGTAPYVWSLSPGSVGSINSATGEYTAPSTAAVLHQAGGCQVYPSSSIFSTKVSNLPLHTSNATWVGLIPAGTKITLAPAYGLNIVNNSTPLFTAINLYTPSANGDYPIATFPWLKRQGGHYSDPVSGLDRHIANVNKDTCEFSELYNTYTAPLVCPTCTCTTCTSNSSAKYSGKLLKYQVGAGVDAAGLPLQPLTTKLEEINQGVIKHPMRFTLANTIIQSDNIWPATAFSPFPSGQIPYGSWLRLKSSFNISGFSATAQVFLQAWKDYGMILADGGLNMDVATDADVNQDQRVFDAIGEIKNSALVIGDFEFVDPIALKVADDSTAVKYDNIYETPVDFVHACVTDASLTSACKYVALQGVAVGTSYTAMTIQAGGGDIQLDSWVTGSSNQGVTWTMSPSYGTLTTSGQYTPPATIATPTITYFTGTSEADTNKKVVIFVTLWPEGVIRVDNARYTNFVGSDGTWFAEAGFDGGQGNRTNEATNWAGIPENATLYHTTRYIYSNDLGFRWWLTPGNYKITLKWGLWRSTNGDIPSNNWVVAVDTNGTVVRRRHDVGAGQGVFNTDHDIEIPCWVQASDNGLCYLAIRQIADHYYDPNKAHCLAANPDPTKAPSACSPIISATRIEPDAGGARIEIDGSTADITFSQTRQFGCIGWFIASTCTWQIVSGPGSLDANGNYTAPSTPPTAGSQAITIRATHSVNTSLTDEHTFNFVFGTIVVASTSGSIFRGQSVQFSASINNIAYTSVTWSKNSAQGTLNASGFYVAPGSVSPDETIAVTATSTDDVSKSGFMNLDIAQLRQPLNINASVYPYVNDRFTDSANVTWINDVVTGGLPPTDLPIAPIVAGTEAQNIDFGTTVIHGPGCDANDATNRKQVYLSIRADYYSRAPYLEYVATVPNGLHNVRLKFLAPNGNTNVYIQDISVQGQLVWNDFDVVVAAGGALRCTDIETAALVTDGTLSIRLTPVGASGVTTVLISGMVITDLGPISGRVNLTNPRLKGNVRIQE